MFTCALPLQDYIVGVVYDKAKDVYLMMNHRQRGGIWFPYSERRAHETSFQTIKRILDPLVSHDADQIHLVKVCSTKTLPCRARDVVFYAIMSKANSMINLWLHGQVDGIDFERQLDSLPDNASLWMNTGQMRHVSKLSRLIGIEPLVLNKQFKDIFFGSTATTSMSTSIHFEEVKIPQIEMTSKTGPSPAHQLLQSAKFSSNIQEQLYEEYHHAVLPSDYLNFETFKTLMMNKGVESQHFIGYFRAFDSSQRNYLTFVDYLLGLAALDPNTQHGSVPAEQRCRFIFRYYNTNPSQRMTFDEFKSMINDIHKAKGQNITGDALNEQASQMFRSFGLRSIDQTLNLIDFLSAVGQLRFRGTSTLFRSSTPVTELVKSLSSTISNNLVLTSTHHIGSNRTSNTGPLMRRIEPVLKLPNASKDDTHLYEIATHIVKVSRFK
jgi:hypothetical protein